MSAAISNETVVGRPFKPGQSGNPNGRPKKIARRVQELVGNDPERLINVLLSIAEDSDAKPADRISATRDLLDRGYGKAPSHAPLEGQDPLELDDIERTIERVVDELAQRREAKATGSAPGRAVAADGPGESATP